MSEANPNPNDDSTPPKTGGNLVGNLRLRRVDRETIVPIPTRIEDLLSADHPARAIWSVLIQLDLSAFYEGIAVTSNSPGRPAIDPLILVAVWIYGLSQGITEARELGRLCEEHLAYIWLCGGVSVNYHTLSDFRVQHEKALEDLLVQVVLYLNEAGLVGWKTQAQDGMRVRTSAGAASFHREPTLRKEREEAQSQVAALEASAPSETTARQQAARERAASERVERLEAALEELPAVRATKAADERDEARVSSTDPEARVMKMADGGFRPAYNWEYATDADNLVIVGVDVVNTGSDKAQMDPMLRQIADNYDCLPTNWLIDGGFIKLEALEEWLPHVNVVGPVPKPKDETRDPYQPLPTDTPRVAEWRQQMGTDANKKLYKVRAATAECVNAQARVRADIHQSPVRGRTKNRCLALWVALVHNLMIWIRELGTAIRPKPKAYKGGIV